MKLYSKDETKGGVKTNLLGAIGVLAWLAVASFLLSLAKEGSLIFALSLVVWFGVGAILYAKFKAKNRKQLEYTSKENITRFNLSALYHSLFRK